MDESKQTKPAGEWTAQGAGDLLCSQLESAFLTACGVSFCQGPNVGGYMLFASEDKERRLLLAANDWEQLRLAMTVFFHTYPFDVALKKEARFSAKGGIATCVIGDAVGKGTSFREAAMRALIAMKQTEEAR